MDTRADRGRRYLDRTDGPPSELVAAIERSMRRSVNVVLPANSDSVKVPPLKMRNITVAELFRALEQASTSTSMVYQGGGVSAHQWRYTFKTASPVHDDSVWFFSTDGQPTDAKTVRFFLMTPYLERGLTVEDVTTALQTGWRMQGTGAAPEISFHRETSLLIAVGSWSNLQMIDQVLQALAGAPGKKTPTPAEKKP